MCRYFSKSKGSLSTDILSTEPRGEGIRVYVGRENPLGIWRYFHQTNLTEERGGRNRKGLPSMGGVV